MDGGWFTERHPSLWPGQALSLEILDVLHSQTTPHQSIQVLQSTHHGAVLVLDDIIQATERDEFAYQESLSHIPLCAHGSARDILVIGGGDGGVLREIVKHPHINSVTLVEIDEAVIQVSKKYLPSMASAFEHPKVSVIVGDGFEFLKSHQAAFDVIITDSSDPVGPAESLFGLEYYKLLAKALKPNGVVCCQGECMWLHLDLIKQVMDGAKKVFSVVQYAYASVPTYPSGQIGFILCSNDSTKDLSRPVYKFSEEDEARLLKYYNPQVHQASFVLPSFARRVLESSTP